MAGLVAWARRLRGDALALWFCARDPRTPVVPKLLALALAAYAFSPIDLIPDFIPILGYLDELILLPAGLWLCLKLIPSPVLADARRQAEDWLAARRSRPRSFAGMLLVFTMWLAAAGVLLAVFVD